MTHYTMKFDTTNIAELAWEYPFKADSDKAALDYATKHAMWVKHDLVVWKDEYILIGRIEVKVIAQVVTP